MDFDQEAARLHEEYIALLEELWQLRRRCL